MLATAVNRCRQKWSVPRLAEPRPRTRPSGVRMLMARSSPQSAGENIDDDPDQDRQRNRAVDGGVGEPFALRRSKAVAGVPDQMPDAAEHVMKQRPGVAEQHELADEAAG